MAVVAAISTARATADSATPFVAEQSSALPLPPGATEPTVAALDAVRWALEEALACLAKPRPSTTLTAAGGVVTGVSQAARSL